MRYLIFILAFLSAFSQALPAQQRKLVWSDEFNTNGLPDPAKWSYDTGGHGWGNHELQFYTYREKKNARIENGVLIIEALKEQKNNNAYTSARLVTKGKGDWTYGRIDVKARLPRGKGSWPAIWMLASVPKLKWPDDGEIDIMEHVGYNPGTVHASVHCKKYYHKIGTQKTATIPVPDFSDSFHVYSLEWDSEKITMLIDNKPYFSFQNEHTGNEAWPFDKPFHLLLNLAVGGDWGGQKGIDETAFPQKMEIDYVRVYQ
ncbi:glycoside hydrolase family 16 protein [Sediminibacterium ginsengisoli]|uniref:Glycosyl hydrolases family 16 n=1 Tax=Sediminibacterium ginsengisoli TaxID=413434 RepID=A0A1T4L1U7_9BACT|nr:glycoside hydrolase family 16 protein [Sediminibacterium ginsengisoli]SJZ48694.1 Glycosyl hydrolases family 16 [Sediminibacterium ginsengisoli]